ncbi:MAG: cobalt-precorrin-4 C(11)-methyltransferase, partial [Treponema sp.]|nr:cobalt-precorrin-4 C(11)-methyltransferase [Treponema sp.]
GMTEKVQAELLEAGLSPETPAALVYKATWNDEKRVLCTVGTLAESAKSKGISKTALIIVGDVLSHSNYSRSRLYDPSFTTEFREGKA